MADYLVQVKIRKSLKESIEKIQKDLKTMDRNAQGWTVGPTGTALFSRDPSVGDIIEQAIFQWKEKHKL